MEIIWDKMKTEISIKCIILDRDLQFLFRQGFVNSIQQDLNLSSSFHVISNVIIIILVQNLRHFHRNNLVYYSITLLRPLPQIASNLFKQVSLNIIQIFIVVRCVSFIHISLNRSYLIRPRTLVLNRVTTAGYYYLNESKIMIMKSQSY